MRNILVVTGGAGFVGSNLISEHLKFNKFRVLSIDNYSSGLSKILPWDCGYFDIGYFNVKKLWLLEKKLLLLFWNNVCKIRLFIYKKVAWWLLQRSNTRSHSELGS